jgi:cbb3-type cytochrome oxidase subunit 1
MFGKTQMWSIRLISAHFWIATIGVVLYIAAMWIAGRDAGPHVAGHQSRRHATLRVRRGVKATYPFYAIRLVGGMLFLSGHAAHGVEHLEDRARRTPGRRADSIRRPRQPRQRSVKEHTR